MKAIYNKEGKLRDVRGMTGIMGQGQSSSAMPGSGGAHGGGPVLQTDLASRLALPVASCVVRLGFFET